LKLLVIGNGQLGAAFDRAALPFSWRRVVLGRAQADLTKPATLDVALSSERPDVVINTAAYTAVDAAESEPELAWAVNAEGASNLARLTGERQIPLVHVSTDFVFDGERVDGAYVEHDPVGPLGVYGASKEAGERGVREHTDAHWILRTSWLFSPSPGNFVSTIARLLAERGELRVVDDQTGSPTSADDLAQAIIDMLRLQKKNHPNYGTYHVAGRGHVTRYALAKVIRDGLVRHLGPGWPGERCELVPMSTADYPTAARRPRWSVLGSEAFARTFGVHLLHWRDALELCLFELGSQEVLI
jgi:dTDP-4-dehydrorhamnose reductase